MEAVTVRSGRRPGVRAFWGSLDAGQRRTLVMMIIVVAALHVIGFVTLFAFVVPKKYNLGTSGIFTIGIGVTAYTLGMRHAFDADHIAAIDNTTRKLMNEGKRPLSVGFWFSLGHSTIVFALAFLIALGVRALDGPVKDDSSNLHQVTGYIGTGVSGVFLYIIAALNVVILIGIIKVFREMKTGTFDEETLEQQLQKRGFMNRFFGKLTKTVTKPRPGGGGGGARARRGPRRTAVVRDPVPTDPVRRRDVAAGLDRRFVHELRLRMGVLKARPQGLLQPHDHRAVGRRRLGDRHDRDRRADRLRGQPQRFVLALV
jgi:membrane-associated phospholipid phosphatase